MKKLFLLCFIAISITTYSQDKIDKAFIKWAKKNAFELPMHQESPNSAFASVGNAIGDAQFVAVSESAHNTGEFLKMNARLIKYFVEEKGFTKLVAETGLPESKFLNAYINGEDIPKDVWTSKTNKMYTRWEEFNEMVEWLRIHNHKVSEDKKVQFYGIDITGGYHDLMPAFNNVHHYLEKVDVSYAKWFSSKLMPYLSVIKSDQARQARNRFLSELLLEQKYDFKLTLELALNHFDKHRDAFVAKTGKKKYEFARQSCIAYFYAISYFIDSGNWKNEDYDTRVGINGREIAMWENFQWVYNQDTTAKIVIINHNVHSKGKSGYIPFWKFLTPFGAFVKQEFGDRYYAIGAAYKAAAKTGPNLRPDSDQLQKQIQHSPQL